MSDISPINHASGADLGRPSRVSRPSDAGASGPTRGSDRVELSHSAQLLSRLAELPDVRENLVSRVKGEIANGSYDTPDKVDDLMDSLLEDLA